MIRILHLISNLGTGGAEMMLTKLVSTTDRSRFENRIVALSGGALLEPLQQAGIEVHLPLEGAGNLLSKAWGVCELIRAARNYDPQPNWIQGWMVHGNLVAAAMKKHCPEAKVAWNIRHTLDDLSAERLRTRMLIRASAAKSKKADVIVSNSVAGSQDHEAIGYPKDKRCLIPNGFDLDRFQPNADLRGEFREQHQLPENAFVIGNLARYHPMKDQARLVEAFSRLPSDSFLVIAGRGTDAPELVKLAEKLGVNNRVRLLGQQDAARVYPALDAFCLSSNAAEGFPNVVGEAMSCGVPCVVTDVGDAARIVGETGIAVPARDTEALTSALAEMRNRIERDGATLRNACRTRVQDEFSLPKIVELYEQLYSS